MSKPAPIEGLNADVPLIDAAKKSIAARLADVRRFEELLSGGAVDADDVHDMRVASRRLRAALELFDRKKQLRAAEKAVRALGDALGEVRELHVQLAWLEQSDKDASDKERPGIAALREQRAARLDKRIAKLRAALGTWTADGAAAVEAALAELDLSGRLGGRRVRQNLVDRLRTVKRRMRAVARNLDPATTHALRIGAKKLRYAAELAQPAFPADMDALIDRLQPLQETLGSLHDADVHVALVEKFLVRADAAEQSGALLLLRAEMANREKLAATLTDALTQLRNDRLLEQLRDVLC
jgi:CHAD domain-containing protein